MGRKSKIAILESIKPHEKRIPVHPDHFHLISSGENEIFFQENYAALLGQTESSLKKSGFNVLSRMELLNQADVNFLLKPAEDDLKNMKIGATLIGWCHAVQRLEIAYIAQERQLTLISMEMMYDEKSSDRKHLFYENNFLTGKLGVEHALSCAPIVYPKNAKISVITYGASGYGAVSKLIELGFSNITVFSRRNKNLIENKVQNVVYESFFRKDGEILTASGENLKIELLKSDIIINCITQDVINPYQFLSRNDLDNLKNRLIIDISCDDKMGFDFSHSTTFDKPVEQIGNNFYYAIDHIPTLKWQEVSLYLSQRILPILNGFVTGHFDKDLSEMLKAATEIKNGVIINEVITSYRKKQ